MANKVEWPGTALDAAATQRLADFFGDVALLPAPKDYEAVPEDERENGDGAMIVNHLHEEEAPLEDEDARKSGGEAIIDRLGDDRKPSPTVSKALEPAVEAAPAAVAAAAETSYDDDDSDEEAKMAAPDAVQGQAMQSAEYRTTADGPRPLWCPWSDWVSQEGSG